MDGRVCTRWLGQWGPLTARHLAWILLVGVQLASVYQVCDGSQSFREKPVNQQSLKSQTVVFRCRIANGKGDIQWMKDGFSLGFDRAIPAYSRYQMNGNAELGEHDLMISDVKLMDDATYECQVLQVLPDDPPLRAAANLTVLVSPEPPEIEGAVLVSTVQNYTELTCSSANGKPGAILSWQRNGEPIRSGATISMQEVGNKLMTSYSTLRIQLTADEDGVVYTCLSTSDAITLPLRTSVQLSVLYPPDPPTITGYSTGQIVRTGNSLKLICVAEGGNPLAQVHWYKNGGQVDQHYVSGNNKAENELIITVAPNDNEAVYECQASNNVSRVLTASVKLTVHFAPSEVRISGPEDVKAGDTIQLSCKSAISNPPATITWSSQGRQLSDASSDASISPLGGSVTTSNITVTLTDMAKDVSYLCRATSDGQTVDDSYTVSVLYPPQQPIISNYVPGTKLIAGNVQELRCTAAGGNPPATVTWWKGDELLDGQVTITGDTVSSRVTFTLKPADNGAIYTCNATSPATVDPLLTSTVLSVLFPPLSLEITVDPVAPRHGQSVIMTCETSSSNPAPVITWTEGGIRTEASDGAVSPGEFGGQIGVSRLRFTPTAAHDQHIYACHAENLPLQQAVSEAVTLSVLYKPVFPPNALDMYNITEGSLLLVNLTVKANPADVTYLWYKDGQQLDAASRQQRNVNRLRIMDGVFMIIDVERTDSGVYVCRSTNAEGQTEIIFDVNVQYPAEISNITENLVVDEESSAMLECKVQANPVVENMITWTRSNYDMSKAIQWKHLDKSTLQISNITKDDIGSFLCEANNGIGMTATAASHLIVKFPPEFVRSPSLEEAEKGRTGKIICHAKGAPDVSFAVFKDSLELNLTSGKYVLEEEKIGLVEYEARLTIYNVTADDYALYEFHAINVLGRDFHSVSLNITQAVATAGPFLSEDVPLIIILSVSIIGMILLICNIFLILFFIHKRRNKFDKDMSETMSQMNTVEMVSIPAEEYKNTYDRGPTHGYPDDNTCNNEEEMKNFLEPPAYGSLDIFPTKPLYPAQRGYCGTFTPSQEVDQQRSFLVPQQQQPDPFRDHSSNSDLYSSVTPKFDGHDEDSAYASHLRQLQKNMGSGGTMDRWQQQQQPQPPQPVTETMSHSVSPSNSSSQPAQPSCNYHIDDLLGYGSIAGSESKAHPLPSSDVRGHLV